MTRSGALARLIPQATSRCMVKSHSRSAAAHGTFRYTVSTFLFPFISLTKRTTENQLYTIHELASTLTLQDFPAYPNYSTPLIANVSTVPSDPPAGSSFAAAEVLIPLPTADYPIPYIYASNRNVGVQDPRGDTIAIFENVGNQLVLRNQVYTGLDQIRGMMHGQQAGEGGDAYIVASGFAGTAGVKVFKRTEGGANLEEVAVNTVLPTRTSFVWLAQ